MSTTKAGAQPAPPLKRDAPRGPQQSRSKASLSRMFAATRELMVEKRDGDFTLQDVARRGDVSIGSIYLRFKNKDELVRAVCVDSVAQIIAEEAAVIEQIQKTATSLREFVLRFVNEFAALLNSNAQILRFAMQRASLDPLTADPGREAGVRSSQTAVQAMLHYAPEFGRGDPAVKATLAYYVVFAALARELSLGSTAESVRGLDLSQLSQELGSMCLAYLLADT